MHNTPSHKPDPLLELIQPDDEILAYLGRFGARLIHANDTVAIEVTGELEGVLPDAAPMPYRLVPDQGSLAKIAKWRRLSVEQRLALVQERLSAATLAALEDEIADFVLDVQRRARKAGLDATAFLGALQTGRELFSRRRQVVEDRLHEAIHTRQEASHRDAALRSVPLARYPDSFELASGMRRRFIAILGPTNSGKTHQAMEALVAAKSGVYLAPLRLLALENYERLADRDVAVSLVTGEERRLTEGATHVASTIEMLDTSRQVEVAVIDEIQMLEDLERGSGWTAAVCGVPARTVYLLGSLAARPAVEALARRLECPLEILTLKRKSPLEMEPQSVGSVGQLQRGDAVIAFSRRDVLDWAANIAKTGLKVATIYGNLSPEVRRSQAQRFREGEADVVVATDAIGMGLNLPCRRVLFTALEKFDGSSVRPLTATEVKQIAGRAGRFGQFEEGHFGVIARGTPAALKRLLEAPDRRLHADAPLPVRPTRAMLARLASHIDSDETRLLVECFGTAATAGSPFRLADLSALRRAAPMLDARRLALAAKLELLLAPADLEEPEDAKVFAAILDAVETGEVLPLARLIPARLDGLTADVLEAASRTCDLYFWASRKFPDSLPDRDRVRSARDAIGQRLSEALASRARRREPPPAAGFRGAPRKRFGPRRR